jgi:hypothetical protein
MLSVYKILAGQNMVDIAMQVYGSAEAVVDLCNDNNLIIGQIITPGAEVIINDEKIIDAKLVKYYDDNNITVASE